MRMLVTALLAITVCDASHAGVVFLGPTPYLSKADSPFPVDGSNPNFYLEDFEDGELNTPGIQDTYASLGQTVILGSGQEAHSIDGDGSTGHVLRSNFYTFFPTAPPAVFQRMRFAFVESGSLTLPNSFGFVWTYGDPSSTVLIEAFDRDGAGIAEMRFHNVGSHTYDESGTITGQFFGITSTVAFESIEITSISVGSQIKPFQIDHVQYGVSVPEPSPLKIIATIALVGGARAFIFLLSSRMHAN